MSQAALVLGFVGTVIALERAVALRRWWAYLAPAALGGGLLYSAGVMLASLVSSSDELWLLVLTYGAMGGIGLGAAYITPIAMLVKCPTPVRSTVR